MKYGYIPTGIKRELVIFGVICFTGWLGYSSDRVEHLCRMYLANGFTAFKLKVGQNLEDDIRRCRMVRNVIGWDKHLVCIIIL